MGSEHNKKALVIRDKKMSRRVEGQKSEIFQAGVSKRDEGF